MIVVTGENANADHLFRIGRISSVILAMLWQHKLPGVRSADLVIDPKWMDDRVIVEFRRWRPPDTDGLHRMQDVFGREPLLPLVMGLRHQLHQAVLSIDEGIDADAHRLAGIAGTLGFTEAGGAWRAVDEGRGDIADARRESRRAIVAIDRWRRNRA